MGCVSIYSISFFINYVHLPDKSTWIGLNLLFRNHISDKNQLPFHLLLAVADGNSRTFFETYLQGLRIL